MSVCYCYHDKKKLLVYITCPKPLDLCLLEADIILYISFINSGFQPVQNNNLSDMDLSVIMMFNFYIKYIVKPGKLILFNLRKFLKKLKMRNLQIYRRMYRGQI